MGRLVDVDELTIEELEELIKVKKWVLENQKKEAFDTQTRTKSNFNLEKYRSATQRRAALRKPKERKKPFEWWRDTTLLIMEVAALTGLVVIIFGSLMSLSELNQEVVQAREQPTTTPTPLIDVQLLPGWSSSSMVRPGNPVPTHLRDLVEPRSNVAVTIPTPSPKQATRIVVPSIDVDSPVVEGDSDEQLKKGVGHHIGTANPGERGNCFLSGHNDIYGEIFKRLPEVKVGDEVFVYTEETKYRYVVKGTRIVEPTEVSVMYPTSEPILTLMTCYPYLVDTHRLIVIAELTE